MNDLPHRETSKTVHVVQGEFHVSSDPNTMITTVLGSCIATCLVDSRAQLGGMNHILLPGGGEKQNNSTSYAVNAMELLINGLIRKGADRTRFQAKVFGGAKMVTLQSNIGERNAAFIREFLANEGIQSICESFGGEQARIIQFWPHSGQARQKLVCVEVPEPLAPVEDTGGHDVELF